MSSFILFAIALAFPRAAAQDATDVPAVGDRSKDFDFQIGTWNTHVKRLQEPLSGSSDWVEYEGTSIVHALVGGRANLVELDVTGPAGRIQGLSLRLYNPQTQQWSLNYAGMRTGTLSPPVIGGFRGGRGEFHGRETFADRSILVRFSIESVTPDVYRFEQAFSDDGGTTWELNWIATDTRVTAATSTNPSASVHEVAHQVWSELDAAWNARDVEWFGRQFSADSSFRFVDQNKALDGRVEIHQHFTDQFARQPAELRHRSTVVDSRSIAPDIVAVDALIEVFWVGSESGTASGFPRRFTASALLQRATGRWQIAILRVHRAVASES